ncbi:phosphatase PAP2 family protein [Rubeoparvulum massiliense]|uniref:phosphatase PAP2 family protein n=1 Tax=Rubeoparvulum massiliense TaxID=1631346 RepID=UPI00065DF2E8|nr:phosphatase PAP2 family protein [Rubeoparvulum massiliense]
MIKQKAVPPFIIGGLLFLALLLFVFMTQHAVNRWVLFLDAWALHVFEPYQSLAFTSFAKGISFLGSAKFEISFFLLFTIYVLLIHHQKRPPLLLFLALLGGWLFNAWLKSLFHRTRPSIMALVEETGYSFPSGHAMVGTAFYGMMAYLLWHHLKLQGKPAFWVLPSFGLFIILMGLSRVYLGVHYGSDVLAGFAAGFLWILLILLGEYGYKKR